MSKERAYYLIKELIALCREQKICGTNIKINIDNQMEYYASFEFREIGVPIDKILAKQVKDRTEIEHKKLIEEKYAGSVRDYFLSMGDFKDEEDGWYCPECDEHQKDSNEGFTFNDEQYCSKECVSKMRDKI